jgi:peptidyl-prolyl cis-trans isomerase C
LAVAAGADTIVVRGIDPNAVVTTADVRAEVAAAPDAMRARMTAERDSLAEAINTVYRRKATAAAAQAAGLDQVPEVQAQVVRARDQAFADALVYRRQQQLLSQVPDMTARALEVYQAQPDRYRTPARVRVRHILLRATTTEARQARRAEAESLLQQVREGADFAALAKQQSDDTKTGENGGELPFFQQGQMVKPFEDAAFALKQPGDLSPVVESDFGLHLIRLDAIQPEQQRSFDQVKESIIGKLRDDWLLEALETWRQGIVDPAKATIDQPALDAFMAEITSERPVPATQLSDEPKQTAQ